MRIALLAGVDGDASALEFVLTDTLRRGIPAVFALGDLVGRGPEPQRVVKLLRDRVTISLRGPSDDWVSGAIPGDATIRPRECLRATRCLLKPKQLDWLASLETEHTFSREGRTLSLSSNAPDGLELCTDAPPSTLSELRLVRHEHAGWLRDESGWALGSGRLVDAEAGEPRAVYLELDLTTLEVFCHRVAYRSTRTEQAVRALVKRGAYRRAPAVRYLRRFIPNAKKARRPVAPEASGPELVLELVSDRVADVYRPVTAPWPDDDVTLVHAVRVATRRLQEALTLAAPSLRAEGLARANRRLRRLRRSLGERRVSDVMIENMHKLFPDDLLGADLRRALVQVVEGRRLEASKTFFSEFGRLQLVRHGLSVMEAAMFAEPGLSFAVLARTHMLRRVATCRELMVALDSPVLVSEHHEFRKSMKRLRYAYELLAPTFSEITGGGTKKSFKKVQDALGDYNDLDDMVRFVSLPEVRRLMPASVHVRLIRHFESGRTDAYVKARDCVGERATKLLERFEGVAERLASPSSL